MNLLQHLLNLHLKFSETFFSRIQIENLNPDPQQSKPRWLPLALEGRGVRGKKKNSLTGGSKAQNTVRRLPRGNEAFRPKGLNSGVSR